MYFQVECNELTHGHLLIDVNAKTFQPYLKAGIFSSDQRKIGANQNFTIEPLSLHFSPEVFEKAIFDVIKLKIFHASFFHLYGNFNFMHEKS